MSILSGSHSYCFKLSLITVSDVFVFVFVFAFAFVFVFVFVFVFAFAFAFAFVFVISSSCLECSSCSSFDNFGFGIFILPVILLVSIGSTLEVDFALTIESFSVSFSFNFLILFILLSSWSNNLVLLAFFISFSAFVISLVIPFFTLSRFSPFVSSFNFSVKDFIFSCLSYSFRIVVAFN